AGKYRLVYFGYTFCPDVCPLDMQMVGAGLRRFEASDPARAARVQPIFVAVFHPRLIGLTGSEAEIARVAREYRIFYERAAPGPDGSYMVNHSRMVVLYGPDGKPMAMIPD